MKPLAYFITFTTYGAWLHGDNRGSTYRNDGKTQRLTSSERFNNYEKDTLTNQPIVLNQSDREIVLEAIIKHCEIKQWKLFAAHIRTNHVHIVVRSDATKKQIMNQLKAWSTRNLRKQKTFPMKIWTTGGSAIALYSPEKLSQKISYTLEQQGQKMEFYPDKD